jgi:hypothetical protein
MVDSLGFYALLLLGLLCLGVLCSWLWLRRPVAMESTDRRPAKPSTRRSADPKPFPGLIIKPTCICCEQTPAPTPPPGVSPQLIVTRRHRPRNVDTQLHYCPEETCAYYGWVGCGNIRTNGHPGRGPWRQLQCLACHKYFQETLGTPLHGKHVPTELIIRVMASLAEGLGIRAVAVYSR